MGKEAEGSVELVALALASSSRKPGARGAPPMFEKGPPNLPTILHNMQMGTPTATEFGKEGRGAAHLTWLGFLKLIS
ncbi:hypothetical protein V6N13_097109 [Hibiscus sabdariffa]|uniref:Uncharacterized protein n=2 Tax=Hibiscus sabdariffa TaxID=183260 RepID=A0ABR1ZDM9_9ROSI